MSSPHNQTSIELPGGIPLNYVLDNLPEAVILLDSRYRLTYANLAARKISRLHPENLNRETIWELFPSSVGTEFEHCCRAAVDHRRTARIASYFYEPFNIWFDITVAPIPGGSAIYYRDITAIRAAEQARQSASIELIRVLEATTDAVLTLDRDWRITYMNGNAKQLVAANREVIGTDVRESYPAAFYENAPLGEIYRRAMDEGIAGEVELFYPDPLNVWLYIMARPAESGTIVFFRDITQAKKTTAALIQNEKLAAVGRLASSIAHEINNPLEAVTNLIYLATITAANPETCGYLETASLELRRVSIIANQTLRFHKQSTRAQNVSCADLYSTVLSIYEGKLRNSGIALEKRKRACFPVLVFEGEIRQVLNNFVGNAIDAMPTGGRLLVRSRDATDWRTGRRGVVLTVADTGAGISPHDRAHIFEAFFTTKGIAGTGLGLWISSEIVARHQGRIAIRSSQRADRHGTVFALFLPYEAATLPA